MSKQESSAEKPDEKGKGQPQIDENTARQLFEEWRQFSQLVHKARFSAHPSASNELLRQYVIANPDGYLAPALLLWMGDNLLMEAHFREAIATYAELVEGYPDQSFSGRPWAVYASCQEV